MIRGSGNLEQRFDVRAPPKYLFRRRHSPPSHLLYNMHSNKFVRWFGFPTLLPFILLVSSLDVTRFSNRTINATQCLNNIKHIEYIAHGPVPAPPTAANISGEGIKSLQLMAFNELFEVALFSSLISNISSDQPGFIIDDEKTRNILLSTLRRILAVSVNFALMVYMLKE